jgi:formiminotetrahydrofolate cyclodeaminase
MKLTEKSVAGLLAAFRSPDPTPGGGSASALAGAIGASLVAMVAALPKPAATTDEDLLSVRTSGQRCVELAEELTSLVDRDSEAYDLVVGAYRLPKSTDDEKQTRSAQIQRAMRAAIEAPLAVMRACGEGLGHARILGELGNPNASSDVQVGRELLRAGLRGARLNVEINLGSVKDAEYVAGVREETERLADEAGD